MTSDPGRLGSTRSGRRPWLRRVAVVAAVTVGAALLPSWYPQASYPQASAQTEVSDVGRSRSKQATSAESTQVAGDPQAEESANATGSTTPFEVLVTAFDADDVVRIQSHDGTDLGQLGSSDERLGSANVVAIGPDGLIYSAGDANRVIRYDSADNSLVDVVVRADSGPADSGLADVRGLAFRANGNLLVSSAGTNQVVEFNPANGEQIGVAAETGLDNPGGIVVTGDNVLWVASQNNDAVIAYDDDGSIRRAVRTDPGSGPIDITLGDDGRLYVAQYLAGRIDVITVPNGEPGRQAATAEVDVLVEDETELTQPAAVSVGPDGALWVADYWADVVQRFDLETGESLGAAVTANTDEAFGPTSLAFIETQAATSLDQTQAENVDVEALAQGLNSTRRGFEINQGQFDASIDAALTLGGRRITLVDGAILIDSRGPDRGNVASLGLAGADPTVNPQPISGTESGPVSNYFIDGTEIVGSQGHSQVIYPELLPGVAMRYTAEANGLTYDILLDAGVDPDIVRLESGGIGDVTVDGRGRLVLRQPLGPKLRFSPPVTYQLDGDTRLPVDSAYQVNDDDTIGFSFGEIDPTLPLVIDPTLDLSTYLGGSSTEQLSDVAIDDSGNIVVVGDSASVDYPTTAGAYDTTFNTDVDVVVSKLDPTGSTLLWSTYLGGSGMDYGRELEVAANGDIVFVGDTSSGAYPTTAGAYTTSGAAQTDGFVSRLSGDGSTLVASTLLAGNGVDEVESVELDSAGDVLVLGTTGSTNFPSTAGAYQTADSSNTDLFVSKLSTDLTSLTWSTFLAGNGAESAGMLSVDPTDGVWVVTGTTSTNMPTSTGAFDTTANGSGDYWVGSVSADGSTLNYGTYLGSTGDEIGPSSIYVVDNTEVHVATTALAGYPTTTGAYAETTTVDDTAYVVLDTTATGTAQMTYGSFLGGTDGGWAHDITVDADGRAYIAGDITATGLATAGAPDTTQNGAWDGSLAVMDPGTATMELFTYIGGSSGNELATGVTLNAAKEIVVAGYTGSADLTTTIGAYQETSGGTSDGFIQRYSAISPPPPTSNVVTVNSTGDSVNANPGNGICDTGGTNSEGTAECTLRTAIEEVNATAAVDTIEFNIPDSDPGHVYYADDATADSLGTPIATTLANGSITDFDPDYPVNPFSWWDVAVTGALPPVTSTVTIDGTTQPGWQANTATGSTPRDAILPIVIDGDGSELLTLDGAGSTVRGLNLTGGNSSSYVLTLSGTGGHTVEGTWVMMNAVGNASGQGDDGIWTATGSDGNTIGGPNPADHVLVGNGGSNSGVWLGSDGNTVQNVWIGAQVTGEDLSGFNDIPLVVEGSDNVIGSPGAGVVVADAINDLFIVNGDRNTAQGNLFGFLPDGTPNDSEWAAVTGNDNLIGGINPGEGNAFAGGDNYFKTALFVNGGNGNSVLGNTYSGSQAINVDVGPTGVNPNDPGDGDIGDNDLLNHPVVTGVITAAGTTTIDYALDVPAGDYRIELYGDQTEPRNPDGYGAGELLVASASITHTGSGVETFQATVADIGPYWLGATATEDLGGGNFGSTSEFGPTSCVADSDGDGLCDRWEQYQGDTDGDTTVNEDDTDDDNDGTPTSGENADPNGDSDPRDAVDSDWDGQPDYLDVTYGNSGTTVGSEQKIASGVGGFTGPVPSGGWFGHGVAGIGDFDFDGVNDMVVGARRDGTGGSVYVLTMNADGTVKSEQKIGAADGGLTGPLENLDDFGRAVTSLGDLDGDGITDIAVSAALDDDGGIDRGAIYILFLNADGTVKDEQKISDLSGGLAAPLGDETGFGSSLSVIGDLDGDGIQDLAVGAIGADEAGVNQGAVYILFLNPDGTVKAEQKISSLTGGLTELPVSGDFLGSDIAGLGDLDGDGIEDIAVGAEGDDDGGVNRGAIYILFLNADGTVKAQQKISDTAGGFTTVLEDFDLFGDGLAAVGDLDGDGATDIAVGARGDSVAGALHILHLNIDGTVKSTAEISDVSGGFTGPLDATAMFGGSIASLGDLDGDGTLNLAIGAWQDNADDSGSVYVIDLAPANTAPVLDNTGTMTLTPVAEDAFSNSGNTVAEIVASAGGDRITDGDGDPEGILIIDQTTGYDNGWWEYSTDAGTSWTRVGWYLYGLHLRDTDRIRFAPAGFDAETATLTFRAWDQTSGSAGTAVRSPIVGGSSAYSASTATATITSTATNDAPVFGWPAQLGYSGSTETFIIFDDRDGAEDFQAVTEAADGSIVAAGGIGSDVLLVRYQPDGSIDPSFGDDGVVSWTGRTALDVAVQADGKIVVAGIAVSGWADGLIARFNADGTIDTTFGGGDGWTSIAGMQVNSLAIADDGTIVLGGRDISNLMAARLLSDGSMDPTFGTGGVVTHLGIGDAYDIALQADGLPVLASHGNDTMAVVRLTSSGALDTTFDSDGVAETNLGFTDADTYGRALAVQPDGSIVISGTLWDNSAPDWTDDLAYVAAARFTPTGNLDTTFGGTGYVANIVPGGSYWGQIESVAIQPSGEIVLAGTFDLGYKGQFDAVLVRHLADGTLDTTFDGDGFATPLTGRYWNYVSDVIVTSSGNLMAAGETNEGAMLITLQTTGETAIVPDQSPLDGAPIYDIGGAPVVMDADVAVYDRELVDFASWTGTSLTIARQGGANPDDQFTSTGTLSALTEGQPLLVGATTVGTVTANSAGTLRLDFGATSDQATVQEVLESLAYQSSATTSGTALLTWTFTDDVGAPATGQVAVTLQSTPVVVNSTGDSPDINIGDDICDTGSTNSEGDPECTLRAAIQEANASAAISDIFFDIPVTDTGYDAAGWWQIVLATDLPELTATFNLDGTTQPGYTGDPVIGITRGTAYGSVRILDTSSAATDSTLTGLALGSSTFGLAASGDRTVVTNNWFGFMPDGSAANIQHPVRTTGQNVVIGRSGEGNIIGNYHFDAIDVYGTGTVVQGNIIGEDAAGNAAIAGGPDSGIYVAVSNVLIGGTEAGEGNRIAQLGVTAAAIEVFAGRSAVSILGNTIVDTGLAVDLNRDGPTENDPGDGDTGANGLLNYPVPTVTGFATVGPMNWDVDLDVTLDAPAGDYRIELYANDGPGLAGRAEGQVFVHAFTVTHPGGGAQTFTTNYSGPEPSHLGATATEDNGDGTYGSTSEFSAVPGATNLTLTVNSTGDSADSGSGDLACDTGGTNSEGNPECTLRAAIEQANRTANATIAFNIPVSDPGYVADEGWTINVASSFEQLGAAMTIDGATQPGWTGDPLIGVAGTSATSIGINNQIPGTVINGLSISGFASRQLWSDEGITVTGNWVGYRLDGTEDSSYEGAYIQVPGGPVFIGGAGANDGNHIVGTTRGITLYYGDDAVIQGNVFGVGPDGSPTAMPIGILSINSDRLLIGGPGPGEGNVVANATAAGIAMTGNNDDDVTVIGNTTYNNLIDIDLDNDGPTTNDAGDIDTGINGLLNHPDISAVASAAGTTTVDYTLDAPAGDYRIDVYADLPGGQTLAGTHTIAHTGSGVEAFQVAFSDVVAGAYRAIATEDLGASTYESTSEFSAEWAVCQDPDGDGLCSHYEVLFGDTDGDGTDNHLDDDDDDDGLLTSAENADPNGDGDPRDALDADRDGQPDWLDAPARRTTGLAKSAQKISDLSGGLTAALADQDYFGMAVTPVGDLDGDGIVDIAVGAPNSDRTTTNDGAVYILLLNADGTVKAEHQISELTLDGLILNSYSNFGSGVALVGDLDGDGHPELAVGADGEGVWLITLNSDGTAAANPTFIDGNTDLPNPPTDVSSFGFSVGALGDLNGDGVNDLLVGDHTADEGGWDYGAAHVIFLNADGSVAGNQVISDLAGGLNHVFLGNDAEFGSSVTALGDIDGDGVTDIAVGSRRYGNGPDNWQFGAVHILMLNSDGTVKAEQLITNDQGGLDATLGYSAFFGSSVAGVGDMDGDGVPDLLAGAPRNDEPDGTSTGGAFLFNLNPDGTIKAQAKINNTSPALEAFLDDGDNFARSVAGLGDLDGDGSIDLLIGADSDDDGGLSRGAVYIIDMIRYILVNSTGDDGDLAPGDGVCDTGGINSDGITECTLRAAIEEANGTGAASIEFEMPVGEAGHNAGVWTINPATSLPYATGRVVIDATTQAGWAGDPVVALDGTGFATTTDGLTLAADYSTVTGLSVINWTGDGVSSSRSGVTLSANWLGIAPDGTIAPNLSTDISLWGGAGVDNIIGGTDPADGNRFAAAGADDGLFLHTSDAVVANNTFGLAPDGVTSTAPPSNAIRIDGTSTGVVIDTNTFANTTGTAVDAAQDGTATITNNNFGLDINGDPAPVGLALAATGSGDVLFGGTTGDGNTVANTTGVAVLPNGTGSVAIVGNSIANSGSFGIDLGNNGITTNDPGDGDSGPNGLLNYPEITSAVDNGGLVALDIDLDVPAGSYRIELFTNPSGANASGYGEGEALTYATTVTHLGAGTQTYSLAMNGSAGDIITATATEDLGGATFGATSEFSAAVTVANPPDPLLDRSVRRSDLRPAGGLDAVAAASNGFTGSALSFNGASERLSGPPLNISAGSVSLAARVRPTAISGTDYLVSKQTTGGAPIYELAIDGATSEAVATMTIGGTAAAVRGGAVSNATWHNIVTVWDGSNLILYVDGVEVDRTAATGTLAADVATDVTLGNRSDGTAGFNGLIDHVDIEHRAVSAAEVEARHANTVGATMSVSVGQQQSGAPGDWTVTTAQARSGSSALAAPATSSGSAAWAVATAIDEPGVVFDSWWWVDSTTGLDVASGTRAGLTPTEQYDGAYVATDSWLLRRRYGATTETGATGTQPLATGTWVNVEQWTDQNGNSRLFVDGVEVAPWTGQSTPPLSGSVGLRVGSLPGGQSWLIDDPRARKLVMPEPVASVSALDQN